MSDRVEKTSRVADDERRFDRLVDGELSPDEYRALLAALDDEPGGWKRCALAFLEAQALTNELGGLRRSLDLTDDRRRDAQAVWTKRLRLGEQSAWFVIVAGLLLAFGLGIVAPGIFTAWQQDQQLAGNSNNQPLDDGAGAGTRHEVLRPVGNLRLVMDGPAGETTQAGQVPVYEVGPDLEQYLSRGQPALGPELIEHLRQQGYEVRHEEQYFPAPLDDGRQVIVPVDGYQITPVKWKY